MPQMSPAEQRHRLSSLITDITDQHGTQAAGMARAQAITLSPEQAILFLELTLAGADGVDGGAVVDLCNLGYETVDHVLAVSRLIESSPHRRTVPTIVSLGLFRARAEVLLDLAPLGLRLLSVSDDRTWRRAMRLLPERVLGECIYSAESQTALWMSVVSAQDGHMAKRVEEFRAAGRPYVAWIVSGHRLELLQAAVASGHEGRGLSRLEIHRAVRSLDRGEGVEVVDD